MNLYKNGRECVLCLSRKKLILTTPEEKVRQQWITDLIEKYHVPANMIQVEVPLSHYGPTLRGRVDIIVSGKNKTDNTNFPLLIVECKAPNVPLTDGVLEQAQNYAAFLKPKVIVVTNGKDVITFRRDEKSDYYEIQQIPLYWELQTKEHFPAKETVQLFRRPDHLNIKRWELKNLLRFGIIGEDTDSKLYTFITNLMGLFLDENDELQALQLSTGGFAKDCSVRFTTFGNVTGGGWSGEYRSLLVKDEAGDSQIVSFSVMGKGKTKDHPLYGNAKGHTMLLVAVDDYDDKSHLSLQLALDRFVHIQGDMHSIWHDGSLTIGKQGAAKKSEVLDFIREKRPELIADNKVVLGKLDNSKQFTWEREDVKEFISNLVEYALLRDQFRRTK